MKMIQDVLAHTSVFFQLLCQYLPPEQSMAPGEDLPKVSERLIGQADLLCGTPFSFLAARVYNSIAVCAMVTRETGYLSWAAIFLGGGGEQKRASCSS